MNHYTLPGVAIVVLAVTCRLQLSVSNSPCTPKSSLTSQIKTSSDNQLEIHTILQTLLRKSETVCYELRLANLNTTDDKNHVGNVKPSTSDSYLLLKISVENVWQEYEVKKAYNFTTPALDVRCLCDCPFGDDLCNKDFQAESNCNEHGDKGGSCFRIYSVGHRSSKCFLSDDIAEVCCSISIFKASSDIYHAFYLSSPKIYYKLKTVLTDHKGNVFSTSSCNVSPENGPSLVGPGSCNIRIETGGHGILNLPNSFWLYEHPRSFKFMVNVEINDVAQTDLKKLGWFKRLNNPNEIFQISPTVTRPALEIVVDNCRDDEYKWTFDAVGYLKPQLSGPERLDESEFGEPIEEFYKSIIEKVVKKYRAFIIYPRTPAPITVQATLNFPVDVVIFQTVSRFHSFRSSINLDKFGNKLLEMEIYNAFGTLFASINGSERCPTQTFSFTVTQNLVKWDAKFTVSHCFRGKQRVCLYTFDRKTSSCSIASYSEENFILTGRTLQPGIPGGKLKPKDSGNWWTSIGEWFDNLFGDFKSSFVTIIMVVIVVIVCCLLRGPIIKLLTYLYKKIKYRNKNSNDMS